MDRTIINFISFVLSRQVKNLPALDLVLDLVATKPRRPDLTQKYPYFVISHPQTRIQGKSKPLVFLAAQSPQ
jgi:hypothetical protein